MLYFMAAIRLKQGKVQDYLEFFQSEGGPALFKKHGVELIGSWLTTVGEANELMTIHGYRDFEHFQSFWQSEDSEIREFMARAPEFSDGMTTKILTPTPYSPLQ